MRRLAALLALASFGCVNYVPTSVDLLEQGKPVRAYLSTPGDYRLTNITANNVVTVDGEVVTHTDSSLVLSAFWLVSQGGYEHLGIGETVVIPRDHLGQVERKKLDFVRTALLTATGVGIAVLAGALLISEIGADSGNGGTPPPID